MDGVIQKTYFSIFKKNHLDNLHYQVLNYCVSSHLEYIMGVLVVQYVIIWSIKGCVKKRTHQHTSITKKAWVQRENQCQTDAMLAYTISLKLKNFMN